MSASFEVVTELKERNPLHPHYPLLPGDHVKQEAGGTWFKYAPGLGIGGFVLSDADVSGLVRVGEDVRWTMADGLDDYHHWLVTEYMPPADAAA